MSTSRALSYHKQSFTNLLNMIRVFHDKIKIYILRQNLHETYFNHFSEVKWYLSLWSAK